MKLTWLIAFAAALAKPLAWTPYLPCGRSSPMHSPTRADPPMWAGTAPGGQPCAPLRGETTADAAVIGAGYSGLSCALEFAQSGLKTVVLDAGQPGAGASGRNAGQWLPGWAGPTPMQVERSFGVEHGGALNRFNLAASQALPLLIQRLGIDAQLRHSGILMVAHTQAKFAQFVQFLCLIAILIKHGVRRQLCF